jgi:hypothetical protein
MRYPPLARASGIRRAAIALLCVVTTLSLPALAQCTKDTECKGDRICVSGICSDAPAPTEPLWKTDEIVHQFETGGASRAISEAERAGLAELAGTLKRFSEQFLAANEDAKALKTEAAIDGYQAALETSRRVSSSATNKYSASIQKKLVELWSLRGDAYAKEGHDDEARAAWTRSKALQSSLVDSSEETPSADSAAPDTRYRKLQLFNEKERLLASRSGLGFPIFGMVVGGVGVLTFSLLVAASPVLFGVLIGVSGLVLLLSTVGLAVLDVERARIQARVTQINEQLLLLSDRHSFEGPLPTLVVLRMD